MKTVKFIEPHMQILHIAYNLVPFIAFWCFQGHSITLGTLRINVKLKINKTKINKINKINKNK